MEEEKNIEVERGEPPKTAECASTEETLNFTTGSPLEMKLNEILTKVSAMENSMTKITGLFEGGVFSGRTKSGEE